MDVDLAFELAGNPEAAHVVEIGCADGRDAEEIIKHTDHYLGFDISQAMIGLARQRLPAVHFEVGDARTFDYPDDLDIVFAFASLLHLNSAEMKRVIGKVNRALKPGGIFYVSLRHASGYTSQIKRDEYGNRRFYLYNPEIIEELAGANYATARTSHEEKNGGDWFEIALQKRRAK